MGERGRPGACKRYNENPKKIILPFQTKKKRKKRGKECGKRLTTDVDKSGRPCNRYRRSEHREGAEAAKEPKAAQGRVGRCSVWRGARHVLRLQGAGDRALG